MFQAIGSSFRILVCALTLAVVAGPASAQKDQGPANKPDIAKQQPPKPDFARYLARPDGSIPLIQDWSTRHVIYTAGYTAEQAERMAKDPRAYAAFLAHGLVRRHREPISPHPLSQRGTLERDWNVSLGTATLQQSEASFPAKYTFDVNAPPSCTNDFVVFPVPATNGTGSSRATVAGTFTGDPTIGQTASITITPTGSSPVTLTLTAGATNSGTSFAVSGTNNTTTDAANLAAAINRNLSSVALNEMTAVTSSSTVTVIALTAGSRVILSAANTLSNFSWGSVTAGKSGSQANIVGLNNLYAGSGSPLCAGFTYPTFMFSYAAGVGPVLTSPVLSLDGQKIAFVESVAAGEVILHVLTLGTGTEHGSCTNSGTTAPTCATAAVLPGSTSGSNATDYTLPLGLAAGASDYVSSPFVDYFNDVLYVGDSGGNLYSVSPVFGSGTPALRSGFPVALSPASALSSPVVDLGNTGNIFVEDSFSNLYNVTSSGVVEGHTALGYNGNQFQDGPVLDSTNSVGYAVTPCNGTPGSGTPILVQFLTAATGSPELLATADLNFSGCSTGQGMYNATLDNNYFARGISSNTPANNGELLVAYPSQPNASLAQFQFTSGIMNTTPEYTDTDNGSFGLATFSPLTEFYGNDQAYAISTVTQSGNAVTVSTTASAFVSNQIVVISGVGAGTLGSCTSAAANAMDGEQTVTITSPTTFTFTSPVSTTIGGVNGSCNLAGALATGPTQDYLFLGSPVNFGKVFTFDLPLTSATQTAAATNTTSVGASSGTGGIIIDNDSSDGQASSIYFDTGGTTLTCGASAACAVKLTQAGLN